MALEDYRTEGRIDWHGIFCHGMLVNPHSSYWCRNGWRCSAWLKVQVYVLNPIPEWWYWNITRRRRIK